MSPRGAARRAAYLRSGRPMLHRAPLASNVLWVPGSPPTPNKVDVKLSADGNINLFNLNGSVSVLADVVGYYADHNHDDRYYTKAQIDGLPSSSVIAGGVVNSAGTV